MRAPPAAREPRTTLAVAGLAALCIGAPGCAAWDAEAQARDRAREWLDCDEVELEAAAETAWHARGCGRTVDVACSTSANSPHCIRVRIASHGEPSERAARTSGGDDPGGPAVASQEPAAATEIGSVAAPASEPAPPSAAERSLRAALDARREDALACASRDRLVVSATWTSTGEVALALSGDLSGAPEEGCVRAALADVRAEGASAPGTILHLLRRR